MSRAILRLAVLLIAGSQVAIPDDLETAYQSLKEAASKNDSGQVKVLAAKTCELARKAAAKPAPESESDKETWAKQVEYARGIEVFTEWALSATAMKAPAAEAVDLLSALEQQNPKSKYLDESYGRYLVALNETGASAKVPDIASRGIQAFPDNEDLLAVLADGCMNRKQSDQALTYSRRLVGVLAKHPRPEGVSAADWERKRSAALARSYWIAGVVHAEKNQYVEADKNLRAALPLIQGNQSMTAAALFHLGVVNYQIGKMLLNKARVLEAAKFSEQAAQIKGPYGPQAWRNAQVMRTEALKMR